MYTRLDYLRRTADDFAGHRISRREFLRRATILGLSAPMIAAIITACGGDDDDDEDDAVSPTATSSSSGAAATTAPTTASTPSESGGQLVIASWGGAFGEAERAVRFEPFMEETGIELILAPQQPDLAFLEAQVTSGNVEWDLANNSNIGSFTLAAKDLLEKIDYSQMDSAIVAGADERIRGEYSVGLYYWSINLAYRLGPYSAENHPSTWAEFWDADTYPGPRGLIGMDFDPPPLEIPLLAAGVAPDALYPLDMDAAFESLDAVRPHITKWTGFAADAGQLMAQGELDLASSSSGNIFAHQDSGVEIDFDWNQGILVYDALVMPKGAPNPENALRYIEFCLRPDVQAAFFEAYPLAPVVQEAIPLIPTDLLPRAVSEPDHLALQVPVDPAWYASEYEPGKLNINELYERWAQWIL